MYKHVPTCQCSRDRIDDFMLGRRAFLRPLAGRYMTLPPSLHPSSWAWLV